ncbi:hypothetical protein [Pseudofrankia sp. DC12]|uniref:hypothetical protein n=1 Tax=Pseudofrankia sp. DC12 TaxID=683315 RepID=UPI0012FBB52D|nr:hypothetical protein [Pseudofrankia sp. DC12]
MTSRSSAPAEAAAPSALRPSAAVVPLLNGRHVLGAGPRPASPAPADAIART